MPLGVFAATVALHFVWLGLFPEQDPAQARWALLPDDRTWFGRYRESQSYWLSYSYGLSMAFASVSFRRYLRNRYCSAGRFAVGGATFAGILAVAGCYLIGCCGSPMLVVWLNLFGARFLPFAKPLLAALTTVSIAAAWVWIARWNGLPDPAADASARQ
ncbi:MAG: hypothetical protein HZB55_20540 [Deltaproteobacteria bacterium]|nr:hypothetical protein [Deltaproteobacteria bacterium]